MPALSWRPAARLGFVSSCSAAPMASSIFTARRASDVARSLDADFAFVAAAGIAAERRFCRWMGWPEPSADDGAFAGDNANIERALEFVSPADADRAVARVGRELDWVWEAVLALVDALVWPDAAADADPAVGEFIGEMGFAEVAEICFAAGLTHDRGA